MPPSRLPSEQKMHKRVTPDRDKSTLSSIFVKRANVKGGKQETQRLSQRRYALHGPVTLQLPILATSAGGKKRTAIDRTWVIACEDPNGVEYVRWRIKELMLALDGTILVRDEV